MEAFLDEIEQISEFQREIPLTSREFQIFDDHLDEWKRVRPGGARGDGVADRNDRFSVQMRRDGSEPRLHDLQLLLIHLGCRVDHRESLGRRTQLCIRAVLESSVTSAVDEVQKILAHFEEIERAVVVAEPELVWDAVRANMRDDARFRPHLEHVAVRFNTSPETNVVLSGRRVYVERAEAFVKDYTRTTRKAIQPRECSCCLDWWRLADGVECTSKAHFLCSPDNAQPGEEGCFERCVKSQATDNMAARQRRDGRIWCSQCNSPDSAFHDRTVAKHTSDEVHGCYMESRQQI